MARKAVQGYTEKSYYDNTRFLGVVATTDPLNEGYFKHLINFDISDTGQSVTPREGYLTTTITDIDNFITLSDETIIFKDNNTQQYVIYDFKYNIGYLADVSAYNIENKLLPITKGITVDSTDVVNYLNKYVESSCTSLPVLTIYKDTKVEHIYDNYSIHKTLIKVSYTTGDTTHPFILEMYYRENANEYYSANTLVFGVVDMETHPTYIPSDRNIAVSKSIIPDPIQTINTSHAPGFINDVGPFLYFNNGNNYYINNVYNTADYNILPYFNLDPAYITMGDTESNAGINKWAYRFDVINTKTMTAEEQVSEETVFRSPWMQHNDVSTPSIIFPNDRINNIDLDNEDYSLRHYKDTSYVVYVVPKEINAPDHISNKSEAFYNPLDITNTIPLTYTGVIPPSLEKIIQVEAGYKFTGVLTNVGRVYTWGKNEYGQLGRGTNIDSSIPGLVTFPDLGNDIIIKISFGKYHALAYTYNGKLYTWGRNDYGQLGDGTNTNKSSPVNINDKFTGTDQFITMAAAGGNHTLAFCKSTMNVLGVTEEQENLYSFGRNDYGQLGIGSNENKNIPTNVFPFYGFYYVSGVRTDNKYKYVGINISIGDDHNYVKYTFKSKGVGANWDSGTDEEKRWGANGQGQLGTGDSNNKLTPQDLGDVGLLASVAKISLGEDHTICINTSDEVFSTGWNAYGQLGDGTIDDRNEFSNIKPNFNLNFNNDSTAVDDTFGVIETGWTHSGLITTTLHHVFTWGNNSKGQLGNNDAEVKQLKPVDITSRFYLQEAEYIEKLSFGYNVSYALTSTGRLFMWGQNMFEETDYNFYLHSFKRPSYTRSYSQTNWIAELNTIRNVKTLRTALYIMNTEHNTLFYVYNIASEPNTSEMIAGDLETNIDTHLNFIGGSLTTEDEYLDHFKTAKELIALLGDGVLFKTKHIVFKLMPIAGRDIAYTGTSSYKYYWYLAGLRDYLNNNEPYLFPVYNQYLTSTYNFFTNGKVGTTTNILNNLNYWELTAGPYYNTIIYTYSSDSTSFINFLNTVYKLTTDNQFIYYDGYVFRTTISNTIYYAIAVREIVGPNLKQDGFFDKGYSLVFYLRPYNTTSILDKTHQEKETLKTTWDATAPYKSYGTVVYGYDDLSVTTIEKTLEEDPINIQGAQHLLVFNDNRLIVWTGNKLYMSEPGTYYYFKDTTKFEFGEKIIKVIEYKNILLIFTVQNLYAIYELETQSTGTDAEGKMVTISTFTWSKQTVLYNILADEKYADVIQVFNQMVLFYSSDGQMFMIKPNTVIDDETRFTLQYFNKGANDILANYDVYINERLANYNMDTTITKDDVNIKALVSINYIKLFYYVPGVITYILVYDVINNRYTVYDTLSFTDIQDKMFIDSGELYLTNQDDKLYFTFPYTEANQTDANVDMSINDDFKKTAVSSLIDTGNFNLNNHLNKRFRDLHVTFKNLSASKLLFNVETVLDDIVSHPYYDMQLEVKDVGGISYFVPIPKSNQNDLNNGLFENQNLLMDFSEYTSSKLLTHRTSIIGLGKVFRLKLQFISKGRYKLQEFGIIYKERRI